MPHGTDADRSSSAPAQQPSACFDAPTHAALDGSPCGMRRRKVEFFCLAAADSNEADLALCEEWAAMFVAQGGPSYTSPAASCKGCMADEGWRDRL